MEVAGLARSTYYYQCQPNMRAEQQIDMQCRIRAVYDKHKGRYGYRRITATLTKSMAEPVNHKCVQRLMQQMELRALIRAKKRSWAVPGVSNVHVPNVLQRNFLASAPNQKWVTDITEFNVNGHKLYLSACMDLYNREIISHRIARTAPAARSTKASLPTMRAAARGSPASRWQELAGAVAGRRRLERQGGIFKTFPR